jgi:hypothetical protein
MLQIKDRGPGIWHVEKFFSYQQWNSIRNQILSLDDNIYDLRFEPMRYRFCVAHENKAFSDLVDWAASTVAKVNQLTNNNLTKTPAIFLWRDQPGYRSAFHADDFTQLPTMQIYLDGNIDQGTTFIINSREVTLPFLPNSGYIMDNRYQAVHGTINRVEIQVRQSIYLIYQD